VHCCCALRRLTLTSAQLTDLGPIARLTNLRLVALNGLGIRDFNADRRLPNLKVFQDPVRTKPGPAGEAFRDCPVCPQMVVVPAGSFLMGSPETESDRDKREGPQHAVNIARPFAVGKYEVRFDEWMLCVQEGACQGRRPRASAEGRGR
jgi:formylglycine-generating enzyme required for sulfatase activity